MIVEIPIIEQEAIEQSLDPEPLSDPSDLQLTPDLAEVYKQVDFYLDSDIDSDDDSLESHLKNLVRKSKTNELRQD